MKFLTQNWWYVPLIGVYAYVMLKFCGCCGRRKGYKIFEAGIKNIGEIKEREHIYQDETLK